MCTLGPWEASAEIGFTVNGPYYVQNGSERMLDEVTVKAIHLLLASPFQASDNVIRYQLLSGSTKIQKTQICSPVKKPVERRRRCLRPKRSKLTI